MEAGEIRAKGKVFFFEGGGSEKKLVTKVAPAGSQRSM